MFNGKAQPYLMSMYTEARHRNKGVASLIVRKMLDWSKKNGYLWVVLHASREGRRVYKALGFRRLWEMGFDFTRTQPVDSTS